jgi:hypothetical protein
MPGRRGCCNVVSLRGLLKQECMHLACKVARGDELGEVTVRLVMLGDVSQTRRNLPVFA